MSELDDVIAAAEQRMREAALELARQDEERVRGIVHEELRNWLVVSVVQEEVRRYGRCLAFELGVADAAGEPSAAARSYHAALLAVDRYAQGGDAG